MSAIIAVSVLSLTKLRNGVFATIEEYSDTASVFTVRPSAFISVLLLLVFAAAAARGFNVSSGDKISLIEATSEMSSA